MPTVILAYKYIFHSILHSCLMLSGAVKVLAIILKVWQTWCQIQYASCKLEKIHCLKCNQFNSLTCALKVIHLNLWWDRTASMPDFLGYVFVSFPASSSQLGTSVLHFFYLVIISLWSNPHKYWQFFVILFSPFNPKFNI